ncbi:hypothetical protein BBK14_18540 [Parafrankia soli]|uniref:Uncharacterized protein n=1 Tax=Parafrankia soli TaxID=2599596 RepID=A0A1S1Q4C1_9ACTN|nr:histidine kinase [Parafrankia soli]OHV27962.1 hypothetical protein BBK14_18540 [Parafrankia soli]
MTQSGTAGDARVADRLMFLMIALQERANRALVEELHDGPMQELTGILLSLASLRRGLPAEAAAQIIQIETRLRDAAAALHRPQPPFRPGNGPRQMLELGLTQRVEGVLVDRLYTSLDIDVAPPALAEVAVVLATVQLLLQESDPLERPARALVAVRSSAEHVELALRVAYADGFRPDAATAGRLERLRQVADVLGARLSPDAVTSAWSAAVRLPRAPSQAGG